MTIVKQTGFMTQSVLVFLGKATVLLITIYLALRVWILKSGMDAVANWLTDEVGLMPTYATPISWVAGAAIFSTFGMLLAFVVLGRRPVYILAMAAVAAALSIAGAEYGSREAAQPMRLGDEQTVSRRHFNRQGKPLTFYTVVAGNLELFDRHGHHPDVAFPLLPITGEVVLRAKRQAQERLDQAEALAKENTAREAERIEAEKKQEEARRENERREEETRLRVATDRAKQQALEDEARRENERREEETRLRIAAEKAKQQVLEEEARRPPTMSAFYAAASDCASMPAKSVRGSGWVVCGRFLRPAPRQFRGYLSIEGKRDIFGNMSSGTDGFSIPVGSTTFDVGPWGPLPRGTYVIRIVVENTEIARMQLRVR